MKTCLPETTASCIVRYKSSRMDVNNSIEVLKRTRAINENLVAWMTNKSLRGTLTVDVCAGIEGSLMAVYSRKGNWLGNEISEGDFALLNDTIKALGRKNVRAINGDAHCLSSLCQKGADFYLFVMALNHLRVYDAILEANRILKNNGRIVIGDPGPTYWICDLVIYIALEQISRNPIASDILESKEKLGANVQEFDKIVLSAENMTRVQYAEFILDTLFGINDIKIYKKRIKKSLSANGITTGKWWNKQRKILDMFFWHNLFDSLNRSEFEITRQGVMPIAELPSRGRKGNEWSVGNIQDCEVDVNNCYREEVYRIISPDIRQDLCRGQKPRNMLHLRTIMARKVANK